LGDGTKISHWFSPNTKNVVKKEIVPPDLNDVFTRMEQANDLVLFAVFLPSRSGKTSIIEEAIKIANSKPGLMIYGAISDPTAMPNYVEPPKKVMAGPAADPAPKIPSPATYDEGNVHIVRAAALTNKDIVGNFEHELLKAGHAIIHDKIVVVDPLSPDGFVAFGSHNLGYKASYENDENLLILTNNPGLIQAYAVHVLDLYDHYRYRAVLQDLQSQHKKQTDGFLSLDSKWLDMWVKTSKGNLAKYLAGPHLA
jgi:phosphatidylserine/phosphatidylglycerophosphate/cardiolipin synthase-like enzyme